MPPNDKANGRHLDDLDRPYVNCPIVGEWREYREKTAKYLDRIDEMYGSMEAILKHTKHLERLDALTDIRDRLIDGAIGRQHTDNKTVMLIVKILGLVIVALLFAIIFLLTGQHFNLIKLIGGA